MKQSEHVGWFSLSTCVTVFEAVADGYHQYYDPGWEGDMVDEEVEV